MSEHSSFAKGLITIAAFVVVVTGIKMAETLIIPCLLSIFIALIFSPLLAWLKKKKVPNGIAIFLVITCLMAAGWLIATLIQSSVSDFRNNIPTYEIRLQELSGIFLYWLADLGLIFDMNQMKSLFKPEVAVQLMGSTLTSFGSVLTNIFMILLTVIFILAEEIGFREKLQQATNKKVLIDDSLSYFLNSVHSYLGIKTALSLLTGILVSVTLWLFGVDYPVMWGFFALLLNFIPTIGSIIAAIPAVLLSLIQLGSFTAICVAFCYLIINVFIGNLLEPKLMGKGLDLSPLVVFLSLVFWGWILGPVGMLLSIPLTIMVKIALGNDENTRWISVMLGPGNKSLRSKKLL